MLTAAGYGALAGIPGFAGGPAVGFSGMLFGASIGGIGQLQTCANDLRQYRRWQNGWRLRQHRDASLETTAMHTMVFPPHRQSAWLHGASGNLLVLPDNVPEFLPSRNWHR